MSDNRDEVTMTPESPKQRVQVELKELNDKILKLTKFLYSDTIIEVNLSRDMIRLLDAQLNAMKCYASILQNRLAIWDRKDTETFFHNFEMHY